MKVQAPYEEIPSFSHPILCPPTALTSGLLSSCFLPSDHRALRGVTACGGFGGTETVGVGCVHTNDGNTAFFPRLAFSEIVCGTAATVVDPSGDDLLQRLKLSLAQVFGSPRHAAAADLVSDTNARHRPTSLDCHANVLLCYLCKTSSSTQSPHNPACFRCSGGFSVNAALEGPEAPQQLRVIFQRKTPGKK